MINVFKTEIYKLFHNKTFYWSCALTVLFVILVNTSLNGIDDEEPLTMVGILCSAFSCVPLFTLITTIGLTQKDYSERTLKNTICCGISRSSIYWGKYFAYCISSLILFALAILVAFAYGLYAGLELKMDFPLLLTTLGIQEVISLCYTLLYHAVGNIVTKSQGIATLAALCASSLSTIILTYVGQVINFNDLIDYDLSIIEDTFRKSAENINTFIHLGIACGVYVLIGFLGYYIFSKKEIR